MNAVEIKYNDKIYKVGDSFVLRDSFVSRAREELAPINPADLSKTHTIKELSVTNAGMVWMYSGCKFEADNKRIYFGPADIKLGTGDWDE